MKNKLKKNYVTIVFTIMLVCFTGISFYAFYEVVATHQELLREVERTRAALEASEKALQEKLLLLEKSKVLKENVAVESWAHIAIKAVVIFAIAGLIVVIYQYWPIDATPPQNPDFGGINPDPYENPSLLKNEYFLKKTGSAMDSYTGDMGDSLNILKHRLDWLECHGERLELEGSNFVSYEYKDEE
jgi:hypothetical protein